jgi:hypothetical protein
MRDGIESGGEPRARGVGRARLAGQRIAAGLCAIGAVLLLAALPASAQNVAASDPPPAAERTAGAPAASAAPEATTSEPAAETPAPRPAKKRAGGINPCMTPDPGFGIYDGWQPVSIGHMILPHKGGITKAGGFDLIVHFHGHEPIRKELVKSAKGVVLVGVDLGIGSGAYTAGFSSPHVFTDLIASVEAAVAKHTGKKKAFVRKLALSSWSAGYGAVEQILRQPAGRKVDALVLLDSLHAGYADEQQKTLKTAQIEPFIEFAKRAAAGRAFMFMSHSSIIPPGYASTTEVADYVVSQLHGKPRKAHKKDVLGLEMIERFDRGGFHMRGYEGDDKPDHCAHIGLMKEVVGRHLQPRWKTPAGRL